MVWKPQQLPPVQRPKPERKKTGPGPFKRVLGGLVGVAFVVSAGVSLWKALQDTSGQSSPFMALVMLMPAGIFIRYAITGQIKMN